MKVTSAVSVALAGLAVAAPTTSYLAKYDSFPTVDVPLLQPIKKYMGLTYTSFDVFGQTVGAGIKPQSAPNVIGGGPVNGLLDGVATIKPTVAGKKMTLKSLYFACTTPAGTAARSPSPCDITVDALGSNGEVVASQTLNYVPVVGVLQAPMKEAKFLSGFEDIYGVTFLAQGDAAPSFFFDNVAYDIC